jgi:hypothetical protein
MHAAVPVMCIEPRVYIQNVKLNQASGIDFSNPKLALPTL